MKYMSKGATRILPLSQLMPVLPMGHWHSYVLNRSMHAPPASHGLLTHGGESETIIDLSFVLFHIAFVFLFALA